MNQKFNFTSGIRNFTFLLMGVGLLSLVLTFLFDHTDGHMKFWSNVLQNTLFFTGIGFLALLIYCAKIMMYSGWHVVFKRVMESVTQFLFVGYFLLLILLAGAWLHAHHLFHWSNESAVAADELLQHKSSFLNLPWFTAATVLIVGIWCFFAWKIRQISIEEDSTGFASNFARTKKWAATFLPVGGFTSAAVIWYWLMSVDPHWYSTLYAWYSTASWLVSMVAVVVLLLIFLKSQGYYTDVTENHLHDLGKYLFAFSIFWTYLWFSQFLLIWYANIGEETVYFDTRFKHFKPIFFINIVMNFVAPFLILMRNSNKRKYGTMIFAASVIIIGHWIDFFQIIRPGLYNEARLHAEHSGHLAEFTNNWSGFTFPGILDIGCFIFFVGLFLYTVFTSLTKANLVASNDAYIEESLHHHVI